MTDGQTRPNVCRSMRLPSSTANTGVENADKVKQSVQHAITSSVTQVKYSRSKGLGGKNEIIFIMFAKLK
jgi:hypothetical protein